MYPLLQDSNTVTHWQSVASRSSLCDLQDNLWEPGDLLWQSWLGWDGIYYWYWCRHRLWQGWLGWQWALAIASIYLRLEEHMLPRFNSEKRWSNILQPNHTILRDKLQICMKIIASWRQIDNINFLTHQYLEPSTGVGRSFLLWQGFLCQVSGVVKWSADCFEPHQITRWGSPHPPIICSLFARVTPRVIVERDLKYCFTVICNGKVIIRAGAWEKISWDLRKFKRSWITLLIPEHFKARPEKGEFSYSRGAWSVFGTRPSKLCEFCI